MEIKKVLVITDTYGWAFWFAAQGMKRYSTEYEVTPIAFHDAGRHAAHGGFGEYDCVFFMNQSCFTSMSQDDRGKAASHGNKCVGIRGGLPLMGCDQSINGHNWKMLCVSKPTYDFLSGTFPNERFFLCHNGVDDEIFKKVDRLDRQPVMGWAGNPYQPLKRYWMLEKFGFPVTRQAKWGYDYFHPDRSRKEMTDFYSAIDIYICMSEREGMPQPVLEASATGLPVVSTPCGGVPEFIDPEWLVPLSPDQETIKGIQQKVEMLIKDKDLRLKVGNQNYQKIVDTWSWKHIVREYEKAWNA
jgi:hypothetical protein